MSLEAVVGLVHDLVDRKRRRRPLEVRAVPGREALVDFGEPFVEQRRRVSVERGHRADHARGALRDHELGVVDDEERRSDYGEGHGLQDRRQSHQENLEGK
jgi:hypothetical protein